MTSVPAVCLFFTCRSSKLATTTVFLPCSHRALSLNRTPCFSSHGDAMGHLSLPRGHSNSPRILRLTASKNALFVSDKMCQDKGMVLEKRKKDSGALYRPRRKGDTRKRQEAYVYGMDLDSGVHMMNNVLGNSMTFTSNLTSPLNAQPTSSEIK